METTLEKVPVINAGKIDKVTGKTGHGWSIYEDPECIIYYSKNNSKYLLRSWGECLKIGETYQIVDSQTGKSIIKKFIIDGFVSCNKDDFATFVKQMDNPHYELLSIK
jgi:hypothetical protein